MNKSLGKRDFWTSFQHIFPFLGLIVIIIVFSIIAGDKIWTPTNFVGIIALMIPLCIGGSGMIFVAAQGSTDMSQGALVAFAGTLGGIASIYIGFWAFVPVSVGTGILIGIFNGVMVSKCKVSSLMVTLSMLITLRAIVAFVTNGQAFFVDQQILELNKMEIKLPIFICVVALMWYLFEYTKLGFFSKCIGENQTVGKFAGIPVDRYKIAAFALSGAMAGLVGVFTVGSIGGISPQMGSFFELQVMISMFVGGIPVTGGATSRFYKLVVGALMLAFLQNGLTISQVGAEASELIQGLILICVVFFTLFVRNKFIQRQMAKEA
ncbi:ABC transporter permease [Christensenellaceae bacterium OttesenSCG-928-K19]|nr:ABC transporter permease [Christensenellaceae bacterium OttesenSCG-928-K19]